MLGSRLAAWANLEASHGGCDQLGAHCTEFSASFLTPRAHSRIGIVVKAGTRTATSRQVPRHATNIKHHRHTAPPTRNGALHRQRPLCAPKGHRRRIDGPKRARFGLRTCIHRHSGQEQAAQAPTMSSPFAIRSCAGQIGLCFGSRCDCSVALRICGPPANVSPRVGAQARG